MPLRTRFRRILPLLLCALPLPAFAAASLSGTITNKTTGKPSSGDDVVLIRLQQTMEETTRTRTDARGHYTLAVPDDGNDQLIGATRLYKHDLETGKRQTHDFGAGRFPGEFVFVPDAPDSPEDGGWLVGLVIDMPNETTDLVVLAACDIEAPPVGRIRIPHRVPPGFHGNFLPNRATA